ncbi:MAG: copper chaperone PCu(A)C [Pseudomonadota bacterium]
MVRIATIVTAVLFVTAAAAHDFNLGAINIDHPWSRATPPGAKVAAGYMQVVNRSDAPVTLTGAAADFANVEFHSMAMENGVMQMGEVGSITIGAGETLTFEPGGLHIMFTGLKAPLKAGEIRKATLDFGKDGKVTVAFVVEAMGTAHDHSAHAD